VSFLQNDVEIIDVNKQLIDVRSYLLDILVIHKQIKTEEITRLAFEVCVTLLFAGSTIKLIGSYVGCML
jgi:hypothetical protein